MKKKYLVALMLLLRLSSGFAQKYEVGHATWADSLRKYLVLDSVYCRDSIVKFDAYDTTFQLRMTKKRPDFNKAIALIDSISGKLEIDINFARLVTILSEFDIKYLSEFAYTIDYFQESYHMTAKYVHRNQANELDIIGRIENQLYLTKMLHDSSFSVVEYLINRDLKYANHLEPYSTTWERYGWFTTELIQKYYMDNQIKFEEELKLVLREDLDINEFYGICFTFGLFNRIDANRINCDRLMDLIDEKTSVNFINALKNLNQKFHNSPCIRKLLDRI